MANKTVNQHYLPQLLLRNFSDTLDADRNLIWVFRRGSAPFHSNPRNVGAERFFYADPDESTVEADLASREGELAYLVAELLETGAIREGSSLLLAELIGQLVVRTKNSREGIAIAGETTIRDARPFNHRN